MERQQHSCFCSRSLRNKVTPLSRHAAHLGSRFTAVVQLRVRALGRNHRSFLSAHLDGSSQRNCAAELQAAAMPCRRSNIVSQSSCWNYINFGVDVGGKTTYIYTMHTTPENHGTLQGGTWTYLVEMEHHVVAELAGAEQLSFLGDLEAVSHWDGVEHLGEESNGAAGKG